MSDRPKAYYAPEHRCWFVPVSTELWNEQPMLIEHARLELKDGELWITPLEFESAA